MRIYLPVAPADRRSAASGTLPARLRLADDRAAWAVTEEARADRPGEDLEDLEYDALQDAVYAGLDLAGDGASRVAVIAGDVPDRDAVPAPADGGAFGVRLGAGTEVAIASLHVTELGAQAVREDDTDPALLWFDAAESAEALSYADGA